MTQFYEDKRAAGAEDIAEGGDMLLFQWGIYDWGQGKYFDLNLTRQIIYPDGDLDHDIWQFSLTYAYDPDRKLEDVSKGDIWCNKPSNLRKIKPEILDTPAIKVCANRKAARVALEWFKV